MTDDTCFGESLSGWAVYDPEDESYLCEDDETFCWTFFPQRASLFEDRAGAESLYKEYSDYRMPRKLPTENVTYQYIEVSVKVYDEETAPRRGMK